MSDTNIILAICIEALERIAKSGVFIDEHGVNAEIAANALERIKQIEKVEQKFYYDHIERKGT